MKLKIKKLDPRIPTPAYATPGAAGLDLCAPLPGILYPGERRLVPTRIAVEIPEGFEGQVRPRSGLAKKHGIGSVNSPGTIDADYRGEIHALLINHGPVPWCWEAGDRIAQLVIAPVVRVEVEEADELSETVRGARGFGSTGMGARESSPVVETRSDEGAGSDDVMISDSAAICGLGCSREPGAS